MRGGRCGECSAPAITPDGEQKRCQEEVDVNDDGDDDDGDDDDGDDDDDGGDDDDDAEGDDDGC
jgi:hypothetical protein